MYQKRRIWTQQPQNEARVDSAFCDFVCYASGASWNLGGASQRHLPPFGVKNSAGAQGMGLPRFGTGGSTLTMAFVTSTVPVIGADGSFTLIAYLRTNGTVTPSRNSYNLIQGGGGGSDISFGCSATDAGGNYTLLISVRSGYASVYGLSVSAAAKDGILFVARKLPGSGEVSLWLDGVKVASQASAAAWTSYRYLTVMPHMSDGYQHSAGIYWVSAKAGALADSEIVSLAANPWQIFRSSPQPLFAVAAGGGASTNLVLADALHGHAADNITLTSQRLLAIQEAIHSHAADSLTLTATGSENLAIQDAAHAHTVDGVVLTTQWLLTIAEALHGHTADNVSLSLAGIASLIVQDATHAQSADSLGLSLSTWLAIVEAAHAHTADAPTLTAQSALAIAEAMHAHYADGVTLNTASFSASDLAFLLAYMQENLMIPTADQIAAAVRASLSIELERLNKLAALSAIDATLIVTPTTRTAGALVQTISTAGDTTTVQ